MSVQLPLWPESVTGPLTRRKPAPRPRYELVSWRQAGRADYSWNLTRKHARANRTDRTVCGLDFADRHPMFDQTFDRRDVECRRCRRLLASMETPT
jgi:hypothetical protein